MYRIEQETIINWNAAEKEATLYTREKSMMKKMDRLVQKHPEAYRLLRKDEYSKEYAFSKRLIAFKSGIVKKTEKQLASARRLMEDMNHK